MKQIASGKTWSLWQPSPSSLAAWTDFRLPFQAKGAAAEFRGQLQNALTTLVAPPGSLLRAEYGGPADRFDFDVENILFYNVGQGLFSHLANEGVQYEHRVVPPPSAPEGEQRPHYTQYVVAASFAELTQWKPLPGGQTMLTDIPLSYGDLSAPWLVWRRMEEHLDQVPHPAAPVYDGRYALQITLRTPGNKTFNLVGKLKPLLDGVVSSFHCAQGPLTSELATKVAGQLKQPDQSEQVQQWLRRPGPFVISKKAAVQLYAKSVRWHPDDDRLVAATVRRCISPELHVSTMDVTVVPVRPGDQ